MQHVVLHAFHCKGLSILFIFLCTIVGYVNSDVAPNDTSLHMTFPTVVTSWNDVTNSTDLVNSTEEKCFDINGLPGGGIREVVGILLVLIVFGTIFGNLLVISAVSTFHELQTITNMFVASLACADLIMGAFVMPVGIPYVLNGEWGLGSLFCDVWISIDVLTVTASIETLCAIALDRYLAITKPFTYTASVTRSKARCFIALIWITSAGIAFIPVQLGWWKDTSDKAQCCYNEPKCCEFITNKTYAAVSSSVSFYIPLFMMIFSYAIVFKEAIRLASQIDSQTGYIRRASMPGTNRPLWNREQRRTVFTFGIIMGIFTISWLPFFIVNLTQVFCNGCVPPHVFTTLNWFGYANSFFNPFIYSHNAQFRQAFVRLLTCLPCSEGFERTKRASLSDTFPRYRESARDSALNIFASFFLSGGSSRKKSARRSATSSTIVLKRDNSMCSGRSPTRSPIRQPRFRLGSEDFDPYSMDNNNDFTSMSDYKRDADSFQAPSEVSGSTKSKHNSMVCLDETCHGNGSTQTSPCSDAVHPLQERREHEDALLSVTSFTETGDLSLPRRLPRYSLIDSVEFAGCCNNGNGHAPPTPWNGVRQIRTRRSKSLFVTAHDVELMKRLRNGINKTVNSSCSNLQQADEEENGKVESNKHFSEDSPLMLSQVHFATMDPETPEIVPREKH